MAPFLTIAGETCEGDTVEEASRESCNEVCSENGRCIAVGSALLGGSGLKVAWGSLLPFQSCQLCGFPVELH